MRLTNWLRGVFGRADGMMGRPSVGRGGSVRRPATTAVVAVESLEPRELLTISVVIDYSLDTNNFFNGHDDRKALLQSAADTIASRLTDSLSAITPSGGNTWTAIFDHPATGAEKQVNNRTIAANTVLVFAGGRDLQPNQAGEGGYGGFSAGGTNSFQDIVDARGQSGALAGTPTDFGPWGGAITFDTNGTNWHFGTTTEGLENTEVDFLSVAQHELAHLFGFGTAPSWNSLVNVAGGTFTGAVSKAQNGNVNAPLNVAGGDSQHWATSVTSSDGQPAAMRPTLSQGQRRLLTAIDFAALDDIGWTVTTPPQIDFGDAPDSTSGTGALDYQTLSSNNGARHTIVSGLFLGDRVDADDGSQASLAADRDDRFTLPGADDEDGVLSPVDLLGTVGAAPTITLLATNTTGSAATLFGWIDYNQNGVFDNGTERAQVSVPNGTTDGRYTLTFPTIPSGSAGQTYARFRLSTDAAAGNSTGAASNGEVEDYRFAISKPSTGVVDDLVKLASGQNGGPTLNNGIEFGSSVTAIGDLDGNGVTDLAVGAIFDSTGGAVYVLRMNADGTVMANGVTKIGNGLNGGPSLGSFDRFGRSVAAIGDLDGDGVTDLAVGASGDNTGNLSTGAVYVLRMNANGTVKSSTKIANGMNGGPALSNDDEFGASVASLGDLDGDGLADLAVGADRDFAAGDNYRGVIYVLRMNSDGTVKSSTKIASGTNGGPALADFDSFGSSVASLGDLDGDGVSDLAVGAIFNSISGAVYVLRMNADGTVKSSTKIASNTNGGPALADYDRFGRSVVSLGDLDGDGVNDLAVGADGDDTGGVNQGAVYVLRMNADGTVKSSTKIASNTNGGPALADRDNFGSSVASLGDLNGDGVNDLAVGAIQSSSVPPQPGAVHVLFLQRPLVVDNVLDEDDGNTSVGDLSLREAIRLANQTAGSNTITFDPSLAGQTIELSSSLTITDSVTINGLGADRLTISGNNATRVFNVDDGSAGAGIQVTLSNVALTQGKPASGHGGAIFNREQLNLQAVEITSSSASLGGGIFNIGVLRITSSTLAGNLALVSGGAIFHDAPGQLLTVVNSTLSDNRTNGDGSAIGQINTASTTIVSSTIVNNRADADNNGGGGGALDHFSEGSFVVQNSIVAGNFKGNGITPSDFIGAFTGQNNLIGDALSAGGFTHGVNGNIAGNAGTGTLNINTILNTTLANNGGPTRTHALITGSPAIDVGADLSGQGITTDQRGAPRIQDGDTNGSDITDIGAFEFTARNDAPSFTKGANVVTTGDGVVHTLNGWATNISDGNGGSQALDFQVTIPAANAGLFTTAPAISADGTLTFTPKAAATGTVTVTAKLHDNGGTVNGGSDLSPPQTFTIQLTGLNKAPTLTKGANPTVNEDSGLKTIANFITNISAGSGDAGQTASITSVTNNNNSLFSQQPAISASGVLTFTPATNASGTATVTVVLTDNGGTAGGGKDTLTTTFTITVTPINDAPILTAGTLPSINVEEDSATTTAVALGLAGVTYAPGPADATNEATQTLTYKITAIPSFLKLFKANGTTAVAVNGTVTAAELQGLTFKTVANLFGTGQIKFNVTDNGSGTAPNVNTLAQTINVTVTPVNDGPPTISNIANVTIAEDATTAAIKFTVTDIDDALVNLNGIIVTATSSNEALVPNSPTNIVLGGSLSARTIQLKPALDQFGTTTITVTATDSSGEFVTKSFTLTVNSVNDVPRVTAATFSISEITTNDTEVGTVIAADPEGAAITAYSILGGNTGNAFKIDNNGVIRVNDASKIDFEAVAKYTLTIKATDASGGFSSKPNETGPITINIGNESIELEIDPLDSDNTITVSKVGNNLVARRAGADLFTPTPIDDVGILRINGGSANDTVVLDASLNSAGSPATKKFTGGILLIGNEGNDKLDGSKITATAVRLFFSGGEGNDTVLGGAGQDSMDGDAGDDSLSGGGGNDFLSGNEGNDRLDGGAGDDGLHGGDGNDVLIGGAGNDSYGFSDADAPETDTITELSGSTGGRDTLDFSPVTTAVRVDLILEAGIATHANRTVNTSATGSTKLSGNFENVIGGEGNDVILGNAAANSLSGGEGDDSLDGDSGNDTINGGDNDDAIRGNDGNDVINGNAGSDTILGEAGNDTIHGNAGNDTLIGGLGSDRLFGDEDSDTALGGRGSAARGGTSKKDTGDVLDATIETINEAFATVFDFE